MKMCLHNLVSSIIESLWSEERPWKYQNAAPAPHAFPQSCCLLLYLGWEVQSAMDAVAKSITLYR